MVNVGLEDELAQENGQPGGLSLSANLQVLFARIGATVEVLNEVATQLKRKNDRQERLFNSLHQVPLPGQIAITAGTGVLQLNDIFKAKTGYHWSVRRLSASGFSAGTVTAFLNGQVVGGVMLGNPEPVAPFPQAGVFTFGRGEVLLQGDDNLTFTATGITLQAGFPSVLIQGSADCMESWLLPDYLL